MYIKHLFNRRAMDSSLHESEFIAINNLKTDEELECTEEIKIDEGFNIKSGLRNWDIRSDEDLAENHSTNFDMNPTEYSQTNGVNNQSFSSYAMTNQSQNSGNRLDSIVFNIEIGLEEIEDLQALLNSWNLSHLLGHFITEKISVNILKIIKRHHIDKLLKNCNMGTYILFEHKLEEWRNLIGLPFPDTLQHLNKQTDSPPVTAYSVATVSQSQQIPTTPSVTVAPSNNNFMILLSDILNDTSRGKRLVEYYNVNGKFQDEQRASLIQLIGQYFEEKGTPMSLAASYRLENEILSTFPNEKLEYYRTKKRGKIYNKCCNLKFSFKTVVESNTPKKQKVDKSTRHYQEYKPEVDADVHLRLLHTENVTSVPFITAWKGCVQYRLNDIKTTENIVDILQKWPFYKDLSGKHLINIDFGVAFENCDGLIGKWREDFPKIVSFLKEWGRIKDRNVKSLIEKFNEKDVSENSLNAMLLWTLSGYLVPTNKIVKRDPRSGKASIIRFTIKESQESFLYVSKSQEELDKQLEALKNEKSSSRPFILCIGEDIADIQEIYVYFDDTKYIFNDIIRAVDICFKLTYLFDLDFPVESLMVWNFIEFHFFKLKGRHSFSKVHILSEALNS